MNKRSKKLHLSRDTVRVLTEHEARRAAGGSDTTSLTYHTTPFPSKQACTLLECTGSQGYKICE